MISNTREYMNETTLSLKIKGYTLPEFLKIKNISLSTYRRYEKEDHPLNDMLNNWIDELESK